MRPNFSTIPYNAARLPTSTAKTLAIIGTGLLLGLSWPAEAQRLITQEKVDSTFHVNFRSLRNKLIKHQHLSSSEMRFVYVVSFMSGIDFNLETYSGEPLLTRRKLQQFENWYGRYKSRIEWLKLQRGLLLIAAPPTDETSSELEALRIN